MRNKTSVLITGVNERIPIQAIKYAAAAFGGFAADYALLLVLKEWVGLHYLVAVPIAFLAGIAVNYLIGIWFVFRSRHLTRGRELLLFLAISLIALAVTEGSMYLFTDLLRVDYRISRLITGAATYLFNFFSRRLLIYRAKRESTKIE
ncbi:MAG: GtrA family protein [Eubacteriales bacterium]|jgi:putative flippase GtrA|nr:GtrA family protein [Eubacteriales bacterium]